MPTSYQTDVLAWSREQAERIRAGRFDQLDLERIAEELEDVGKSEVREFESRLSVLLAHLLKWAYQPQWQGASWARTIKEQRRGVMRRMERTPSLRPLLADTQWWADIWSDALTLAISETGLDVFPESCPWSITEVLREGWLPSPSGSADTLA